MPQQYRADAAIENLKKLSVCEAKVIRGGKVVRINAEELVTGDINGHQILELGKE